MKLEMPEEPPLEDEVAILGQTLKVSPMNELLL